MEVLASEIKEMFDNFTKKEWDDLIKRLSYFFFAHYAQESRLEREDLIQAAILAVYEGRRHWPAEIKLVTFLCGVMRSIASHILEKGNKYPHQSIEETSDTAFPKKESICLQLQLELLDLVSGDLLLREMAKFFIQDSELWPRDYQDLMPDISEKDIHNAYRRLNKLIHKLKKERENG